MNFENKNVRTSGIKKQIQYYHINWESDLNDCSYYLHLEKDTPICSCTAPSSTCRLDCLVPHWSHARVCEGHIFGENGSMKRSPYRHLREGSTWVRNSGERGSTFPPPHFLKKDSVEFTSGGSSPELNWSEACHS